MTEEQQKILAKMADRLETLVEYKIDRNPEHYHKLWAGSGAGYGAGEWEYDEDKAKEDVIDDIYDWVEDDQMITLFQELLRIL